MEEKIQPQLQQTTSSNNNQILTSSPNNFNTNTPASSLSSLYDQEIINPLITTQITQAVPAQNNFYNHSSFSNQSSNIIRTNLTNPYTNYYNHEIYETYAMSNTPMNNSTASKKQFIKVKDCTTWLSISNPKNSYQTLKNTSSSKNPANKESSVQSISINNRVFSTNGIISGFDSQQQSNYNSHINRINMLLNRRVPRVNT